MLTIDILTLFPEMFEGPFDASIIKRARENKLVDINLHNLRDWATDKYKSVDDRPYGGGPGMVMRVDIIDRALSTLKSKQNKSIIDHQSLTILLSAKGRTFNQKRAQEFSKLDHLILVAGHYEGVDERVAKYFVDEEISIGNYVLSGGEIPIMAIVDATVRLIPEALGNPDSLNEESHSSMKIENSKIENFLEYPQYTRPEIYKGKKVPKVLFSGNHKEIKKWKDKNSKKD